MFIAVSRALRNRLCAGTPKNYQQIPSTFFHHEPFLTPTHRRNNLLKVLLILQFRATKLLNKNRSSLKHDFEIVQLTMNNCLTPIGLVTAPAMLLISRSEKFMSGALSNKNLTSSPLCSSLTCKHTLNACVSCTSSIKLAIEVVATIISLHPTGGTLRIRTSKVCRIKLENRCPTGVYSIIRSISSMKMIDKGDL